MTNRILLILIPFLMTCCGSKSQKLEVVKNLDIQKYSGTWYEIARLPNSFETELDCITATYTILDNGKVEVFNKGYYIGDHSKWKDIKGLAKIPDKKEPAKLKVSFFRPFWAKYWIFELDNDYQYALVGHPNRKYFWILSRTSQMDEALYQKLIKIAGENGFDTTRIIRVNQKL